MRTLATLAAVAAVALSHAAPRPPAAAGNRAARSALGRHGGGEERRGRVEAAGEQRGEPVDQRAARVVRDLRRQGPVAPPARALLPNRSRAAWAGRARTAWIS